MNSKWFHISFFAVYIPISCLFNFILCLGFLLFFCRGFPLQIYLPTPFLSHWCPLGFSSNEYFCTPFVPFPCVWGFISYSIWHSKFHADTVWWELAFELCFFWKRKSSTMKCWRFKKHLFSIEFLFFFHNQLKLSSLSLTDTDLQVKKPLFL